MNIILIGFMGSGKSSVGKELARLLKLNFIDMDDLVVEESKRKSIPEIFEKDGETHFRELEIKVAKKLSDKKDIILATGGGVVLNRIILDYLRKDGVVIFLETSFEQAKKRLQKFTDRPLFKNLANAKKIFNQRQILYKTYADKMIKTDKQSIKRVAEQILNII